VNEKVSAARHRNAANACSFTKPWRTIPSVIGAALAARGVEMRGCECHGRLIPSAKRATDANTEEYIDLVTRSRWSRSLAEAVAPHIAGIRFRHHTGRDNHTRTWETTARAFHETGRVGSGDGQASTRFNDGLKLACARKIRYQHGPFPRARNMTRLRELTTTSTCVTGRRVTCGNDIQAKRRVLYRFVIPRTRCLHGCDTDRGGRAVWLVSRRPRPQTLDMQRRV